MGTVKATAIFQYHSHLPRDTVQNNFYFRTAGPTASTDEVTTIVGSVEDFYRGDNVVHALEDYLNDYIDDGTSSWTIRIAGFDPTTGTETTTEALIPRDLTIPSTVGYPLEVACCLTIVAAPLVLSQKARARGRIYFGPINSTATTQLDPGPPVPSSVFLVDLQTAGQRLLDNSVAGFAGGDPAPWVIYSRADADTKEVTGGWVDNEWDTQRRRGLSPTVREAFGFVP